PLGGREGALGPGRDFGTGIGQAVGRISQTGFRQRSGRAGRNLVITGSNSRLLSRELGSALTGRHLSFELLPFGFQEFLSALGKQNADDSELFERYLIWGGFPEVVLGSSQPSDYLRALFDSVIAGRLT